MVPSDDKPKFYLSWNIMQLPLNRGALVFPEYAKIRSQTVTIRTNVPSVKRKTQRTLMFPSRISLPQKKILRSLDRPRYYFYSQMFQLDYRLGKKSVRTVAFRPIYCMHHTMQLCCHSLLSSSLKKKKVT